MNDISIPALWDACEGLLEVIAGQSDDPASFKSKVGELKGLIGIPAANAAKFSARPPRRPAPLPATSQSFDDRLKARYGDPAGADAK